jgi:hypothetical protein
MPITGNGWELLVKRIRQHLRPGQAFARTVSTYQVFHNGQPAVGLSGMMAERQGPGDNGPSGVTNHRRIARGTYPLSTHDGIGNNKYMTIGYSQNTGLGALPRPCVRLLNTGSRSGILIHPASGYLWSIGCLNPGTSLNNAADNIQWGDSRTRVIALLQDMRQFLGNAFPSQNNRPIPRASVVIEGEPG